MKPPIPAKIRISKIGTDRYCIERNGILDSTSFTSKELLTFEMMISMTDFENNLPR